MPTTAAPRPPKPMIGIINTSFDPDHMGGNVALSAAGRALGPAPQAPWIMAHEKAASHLPKGSSVPSEALPSEAYEGTNYKLNYFNGEGVVLWHMPAAHTDGDTIVQFRESEVLAVGDILNTTGYPVIDIAKGGCHPGRRQRAELDPRDGRRRTHDGRRHDHRAGARPPHRLGGRRLLPGHDDDHADRVSAATKKGMTVPQMKAAG